MTAAIDPHPSLDELIEKIFPHFRCCTHEHVQHAELEALRDPETRIEVLGEEQQRTACRELQRLARIAIAAWESQRHPERFPGAHRIAADFLQKDLIRMRRRLHAELHILTFAHPATRKKFVIGTVAERQALIDWVVQRNGIEDKSRRGGYRMWMELPE